MLLLSPLMAAPHRVDRTACHGRAGVGVRLQSRRGQAGLRGGSLPPSIPTLALRCGH